MKDKAMEEVREEYPREVNGPAFSVSKTMHNGYPALQAAGFAKLRHQTRRHQLHLPTIIKQKKQNQRPLRGDQGRVGFEKGGREERWHRGATVKRRSRRVEPSRKGRQCSELEALLPLRFLLRASSSGFSSFVANQISSFVSFVLGNNMLRQRLTTTVMLSQNMRLK
ncbi:hypothetical protein Ahy_A07g034053 isoform C [Arachis hypogaea]|uniref:Uncharacterized protein n=1 Tax=Arachis hypogaea TaxID=3818 RepID=A0A445CAT7_ARAHY|nr:hypothetical protein Ahy_A07g034053 isoform C [Arachis hypogaea]